MKFDLKFNFDSFIVYYLLIKTNFLNYFYLFKNYIFETLNVRVYDTAVHNKLIQYYIVLFFIKLNRLTQFFNINLIKFIRKFDFKINLVEITSVDTDSNLRTMIIDSSKHNYSFIDTIRFYNIYKYNSGYKQNILCKNLFLKFNLYLENNEEFIDLKPLLLKYNPKLFDNIIVNILKINDIKYECNKYEYNKYDCNKNSVVPYDIDTYLDTDSDTNSDTDLSTCVFEPYVNITVFKDCKMINKKVLLKDIINLRASNINI